MRLAHWTTCRGWLQYTTNLLRNVEAYYYHHSAHSNRNRPVLCAVHLLSIATIDHVLSRAWRLATGSASRTPPVLGPGPGLGPGSPAKPVSTHVCLTSPCCRQDECVELLMGSLLLSREGLLQVGGQLPPWVSGMRGWRWSYHFANRDSRRCWLTIDDIVRSPWTVRCWC